MGCLAEVWASANGVNLAGSKKSHKYLIESILTYNNYNFKSLAEILDVSPLELSQVARGFSYLDSAAASRLIEWFFIFIGECD